jgi:5-methylcytosine-specific restriction endonuclease McrA
MQIDSPMVVATQNPAADLDRLGDEIAELSAHLEAATARLLDLIREFDARGGWNTGFRSCAAWLSWRVGLDPGAARERVRVARALETLSLLAQALARGELSYAKVRALTRVATPETEARLLGVGRAGTAVHVECIVRGWRRVDRLAEAREAAGQHKSRALSVLAETALHHELDPGAPGERYQVVVHVDAAVLADPDQPGQSVLEEGARVSAETSRRLACDASRVVMRHDEAGRLLDVGARTRTIPPALRRALHHRDRGCRFPGCGGRFTQGHHIRHWAQGGPTTLSNLALLCRRHHRAVHEEGYQVAREPDGVLCFRRPDGRLLPEVPPPAPVPADPVNALRATHEVQRLRLHARTMCAGWLGERLDVGWAIDVLHPLALAVTGDVVGSEPL